MTIKKNPIDDFWICPDCESKNIGLKCEVCGRVKNERYQEKRPQVISNNSARQCYQSSAASNPSILQGQKQETSCDVVQQSDNKLDTTVRQKQQKKKMWIIPLSVLAVLAVVVAFYAGKSQANSPASNSALPYETINENTLSRPDNNDDSQISKEEGQISLHVEDEIQDENGNTEPLNVQKQSIAAGGAQTIGLRTDGTVLAVGTPLSPDSAYASEWIDFVSEWDDIVAVSAGENHVVGLRADGTVVAFGQNKHDIHNGCAVDDWSEIVAIDAGPGRTVGLKKDGTVLLADGSDPTGFERLDIDGWSGIVSVVTGDCFTVGLRSNGDVVFAGINPYIPESYIREWQEIEAVSAGKEHVIGLRSDGTVVAAGYGYNGICDVSGWTDIVAVSAGGSHSVGLRSDGTVVAVGSNDYGQCNVSNWKDIVAVAAGQSHTVGLRSDGTVVAVGNNSSGQCNVSDWADIAKMS